MKHHKIENRSRAKHFLRLIIILPAGIFFSEVFAMVLLFFSNEPFKAIIFLDAAITTLLVIPLIYLVSYRPLLNYVSEQERSASIMQVRLKLMQFAPSHNVHELLQATLNELEILTDSAIGFFHFLEADQKTLYLQAWSTNTIENMCDAKGKDTHYPVEKAGVWADCIRQRQAVVHNDYASLPNRKGIPDGHAPILREVAVPVIRNEKVVAILGVGNKPTPYNDEDVDLVSKLADFAWDIIERKRAEERLHLAYDELEVRVQDRTDELRIANSELEAEILERRRVEEALRSARDDLELRVQERTKELEVKNRELLSEIYEREEAERQLRIQTTAMEAAANGILITDANGEIMWTNPALSHMTGFTGEDLIGQSTRLFKSGQHEPEFYAKMWATVKSGQVWQGEMVNKRKDGSLYFEEQTITPVPNENGQISYFIAIKSDITEQKEAEEELERRNRELQALSISERKQRQTAETLRVATQALTQSLDLDTVLNTLLQHITGFVDTNIASVGFVEDETRLVSRVAEDAAKSKDPEQFFIFPIDVKTDQFFQRVASLRKSLFIRDASQDPDWIELPGMEPIRSWLGVPILIDEKVIGVVLLGKKEPSFFTPEHAQTTEALVSQAAVAIQNAWLFEQVRSGRERLQLLSRRLVEVQEFERRYIARELHDHAGQSLTSLILGLGRLEKWDNNDTDKQAHTRKLKTLTASILEDLHRLAVNLRPASLDHLGLVTALEQLVSSFAGYEQLEVKFKSVGIIADERLPAEVESTLYRIVQEALTNVLRHAAATYADVILEKRGESILLIVEDNGKGFDASLSLDQSHLGLTGIQERTEMLGGNLTIESTVGIGTTLVVEVPDVITNLAS